MDMSNTQSVPAPPEQTWRALNDPEILKACIPGCESIEKISDTEYLLAMTAKVGPVSAKFKGKMQLADLKPPESYRIVFEGQGGAAGFAKGDAKVSLAPEGSGTRITYAVHAQVGGKLAQIGSRLVDGAARKMAEDFFGAFVRRLGGAPTPAPQAAPSPGRRQPWFWVAVAVAVIVILYLLLR